MLNTSVDFLIKKMNTILYSNSIVFVLLANGLAARFGVKSLLLTLLQSPIGRFTRGMRFLGEHIGEVSSGDL
jgi:hypothetical protein